MTNSLQIFRNHIFENFLLALLYFLTGKASFALSHADSIVVSSIFFPEGIALAFVLLRKEAVLPGVFAGQLLLALTSGLTFMPAFAISLINTVEAFMGLRVLQAIHFHTHLKTLDDLYKLIFTVMLLLQPFSALLGNMVLLASEVITKQQFLFSTLSWYFGNIMGQLLITPFALLLYYEYLLLRLHKIAFTLMYALGIGYLFFILFPVQNLAILLTITVTSVILISTYIGFLYATFFILIINIFALLSIKYNLGLFVADSLSNNIININFFILSLIFVTYIYNILFREKEKAYKKVVQLNSILQKGIQEEIQKRQDKEKMLLAQSRLAQMGEVIAMIAHQWKQPLHALALLTQNIYLKYKTNTLDTATIEKFKQDTQKQISIMNETLNNFMEFFNPQQEKESFELTQIIYKAVSVISALLEKSDITLITSLQANTRLYGYPNEFGQVIVNMLTNAKDALEESSATHKRIIIKSFIQEQWLYLEIKDNAGGIAPDIIEKIFDPYFSTKKKKNGTGLGLYIAKIVIENHMNGKIEVQSDSKGSRFLIILPLQKD